MYTDQQRFDFLQTIMTPSGAPEIYLAGLRNGRALGADPWAATAFQVEVQDQPAIDGLDLREALDKLIASHVVAQQQMIQFSTKPRNSRWEKVSADFLVGKTCAACGTSEWLETHHIHPFHDFPERELDPKNFIALCRKPGHLCHFIFGHACNWKGYVKSVVEDAARHLEHVKESRRKPPDFCPSSPPFATIRRSNFFPGPTPCTPA